MKISILMKYPNPHLIPIFKELNKIFFQNYNTYYINEISEERPGYDWELFKSPNFRKINFNKQFLKSLLHSDLIIFHGIWVHLHIYLTYFFISILFKKKIIILSESDNVYNMSKLKRLFRYMSVFLVNKRKTTILTLGGYQIAKNNFTFYGFREKNIHQFGYCGSIEKMSDSNIFKNYNSNELITLLYVGQLIHRKGLDLLIKSLAELRHLHWKLIVCGTGEEYSSLLDLTSSYNLSDKIIFKGHCNRESLKTIYNSADIFILPSRFDGWGAVLNEAASYSLPLITSKNVRSSEELVLPFKNGFIFSNIEELSATIEFLIQNKNILNNLRENSFKISQRFSASFLASELNQIITEL